MEGHKTGNNGKMRLKLKNQKSHSEKRSNERTLFFTLLTVHQIILYLTFWQKV
jgi:hypothetical protein